MRKKVDIETGKEIDIDIDASNSLLIIKPSPFEMTFEPRSEKRKEEMIGQWKEAEKKDGEERLEFVREAMANNPQILCKKPMDPPYN